MIDKFKFSGIKNRLKKHLSIVCFALLVVIAIQPAVFAVENADYTLIDGTLKMPIPETYTLKQVINNPGPDSGFSGFNNPEDLYYNKQGFLFIADTNNNRIVKITKDGKLADVFYGPKNMPLNHPQGVFADDNGNMYIADTGNYRIVHLSSDGTFVEQFKKPTSELLSEDFIFDPTKVLLSSTGYIYALKGQSLMTLDAFNNFRGYVGQSKIGFSLRDLLVRIFASIQQKKIISKRIAASYTNVFIDENNMIYATTLDSFEGEIKNLNSIGVNIYKKYGAPLDKIVALMTKIQFDDNAFVYGNPSASSPYFVDLAVDKNGIITAIDRNTCNLFQYDNEGNLLTSFGRQGDRNGFFTLPISVVVDEDGLIYVLDKTKNNIQIFEPTAFIQNIHQAVIEYNKGDYDAAYKLWQNVLITGENYQLANVGMAKTLFKQEKWTESMEQYKNAGDRIGYSKAYEKYRHSIFRGNFIYVIIGLLFFIAALVLLGNLMKKASEKAVRKIENNEKNQYSTKNTLMLSFGVLFHPIDTFRLFKKLRGHVNVKAGVIILAILVLVRCFYIYILHFPLVSVDPRNANIWLEFVMLILPVITFVIASYAITAIVGGESKLDEIFTASTFCMVPYIIINIPLALFSNIMCRSEEGLFTFIIKFSWAWIFILFLLSIMVLNNYNMKKTIFVAALSILTTVLIWIVVLLGLSMTAQLVEFVSGLIREIKMSRL